MSFNVYITLVSQGRAFCTRADCAPNVTIFTDKKMKLGDMLATLFTECHVRMRGLFSERSLKGNMLQKLNYKRNEAFNSQRRAEIRAETVEWLKKALWVQPEQSQQGNKNVNIRLFIRKTRLKYLLEILKFIHKQKMPICGIMYAEDLTEYPLILVEAEEPVQQFLESKKI